MPRKPVPIDEVHADLVLLDRLEELREDMEELEITSYEQLLKRIVELEAQLDDIDEVDDGPV